MKLSNAPNDRVRLFMFVGILFCSALPSRADFTVGEGWDLFHTPPGTATFPNPSDATDLIPFKGVNLGSFDFDRGIGVKAVGNADTIVQRLFDAGTVTTDGTGHGSTAIEMVKLQLASVDQVNFAGHGLDTYYVTLQSTRGGPKSTGSMNIQFGTNHVGVHGTYDSSIDVFFDIRKGSLTGPIVQSNAVPLTLSSTGTPWTHVPPSGALLIDEVNFNLKGDGTIFEDLWSEPKESHPGGIKHEPVAAAVPFEFFPSVGMILFSGLLGLRGLRRRKLQ